MFSFGASQQDDQNTPFFQDNDEGPSIFSSQVSPEMTAFELFNSTSLNSLGFKNGGGNGNGKENGRDSKKSIIMELDQFDRRESFKNMEEMHSAQEMFMEKDSAMVESQVKNFESSQILRQSLAGDNDNKAREKAKPNNKEKPRLFEKLSFKLPSSTELKSMDSSWAYNDKTDEQKKAPGLQQSAAKKIGISSLSMNFQEKIKQIGELRRSKAIIEDIKQDVQESRVNQPAPKRTSISGLKVDFGNILKRSTAREIDEKKDEDIQKSIQTVPKVQQIPHKSKQQPFLTPQQPPKSPVPKKQSQKPNKPREKPCFNLKLIKQHTKIDHKIEVEKKTEANNMMKQHLLNKRDDIATAKILREGGLAKSFGFQMPEMNKNTKPVMPEIVKEPTKEIQVTPKAKTQHKNLKILFSNNRQTQKLKPQLKPQAQLQPQPPSENDQPEAPSSPTSNQQKQNHRLNYHKYEDQINALEEQIQLTKKKSATSEEGFKKIFLLLSKANMMLNEKFLSQTQGQPQENKDKTHL